MTTQYIDNFSNDDDDIVMLAPTCYMFSLISIPISQWVTGDFLNNISSTCININTNAKSELLNTNIK